MRDYPRLSIFDFGKILLKSEDLDPVYTALYTMDLRNQISDNQLHRWLVAYWCFYHCGAASWISEGTGKEFGERLTIAALNLESDPAPVGGRWPRGHERRHFRGKNAELALSHLFDRFGSDGQMATKLIRYLGETSLSSTIYSARVPFKTVSDRAQTLVGFGPWISWKIADMMERVVNVPVDFNGSDIFMFKDPAEAALLYYQKENPGKELPATKSERTALMQDVAAFLLGYFRGLPAPPRSDRFVNIQEVETILCKWKSHVKGFYPINNDIHEINQGLEAWAPVSETARRFQAAMPEGVP